MPRPSHAVSTLGCAALVLGNCQQVGCAMMAVARGGNKKAGANRLQGVDHVVNAMQPPSRRQTGGLLEAGKMVHVKASIAVHSCIIAVAASAAAMPRSGLSLGCRWWWLRWLRPPPLLRALLPRATGSDGSDDPPSMSFELFGCGE